MIYTVTNLHHSKSVRFKKQIRTIRDRIPLPFLLPEADRLPEQVSLELLSFGYAPQYFGISHTVVFVLCCLLSLHSGVTTCLVYNHGH